MLSIKSNDIDSFQSIYINTCPQSALTEMVASIPRIKIKFRLFQTINTYSQPFIIKKKIRTTQTISPES